MKHMPRAPVSRGKTAFLPFFAIALILLAPPLFAGEIPACGTDISASERYFLTGNLVANPASTCLTIGGSDIIIDCAGFSITGDSTASTYGITSNAQSNIAAGNCTISGFDYGVYFSDVTGGKIHNSAITATAATADIGIYIRGGSGIMIYNNTVTSNAGAAIRLEGGATAINLTNNSVTSTSAQGINLNSVTLSNFTNNTITASTAGQDAVALVSSSGNIFVSNFITGERWVNDNSGPNTYNNSTAGNIYYDTSGNSAWSLRQLIDANGDGWADGGTGYPISSTTSSCGGSIACWVDKGSDSRPKTLTLDTTAPTLSGAVPVNGSYLNNSNTSFNFTVSDILTNITCNLSIDGTANRSNFIATSGVAYTAYVNATAGLSQGAHRWNVTCWDFLNNTRRSATQNFTIDTEPPALALNAPANGLNTSSTNVTFNITASDNATGIQCNLSINGALNRTNFNVTSSNNTAYAFYANASAGSSMKDGNYNWSVTCRDYASNAVFSSVRNFTVDATAPTITLNAPAEGFNTSTANVTFNFTAYDNLSLNITCNLSIDGALNRSNVYVANNTATTTYLNSSSGFADGAHNWSVSCWDTAGNAANSSTRNFTVDTAAPAITLNAPAEAASSTETNVTFNFTASDNGSTNNITCNLSIDGALNRSYLYVVNNTAYTTFVNASSGFPVGSHNWSVSCWDNPGNAASSETRNFTVSAVPSLPSPSGGTTGEPAGANNGGGEVYIAPKSADAEAATDEQPQEPQPEKAQAEQDAEAEKAEQQEMLQSGASDAIAGAQAVISAGISGGKDVTEAIWRISAAKAAYDKGDYVAAQELAQEALALGENAKMRADGLREPISGQTPLPSVQPPQAAGMGLLLGAAAVLLGLAAAAYWLMLKPLQVPKKK